MEIIVSFLLGLGIGSGVTYIIWRTLTQKNTADAEQMAAQNASANAATIPTT